jgi:hypothetical protein
VKEENDIDSDMDNKDVCSRGAHGEERNILP